jgi:hypothetical protein
MAYQGLDSYVHFAGGMNSGFDPANLQESQYARGINVSCRGGVIRTRPDFKLLDLQFQSNADRERFRIGKFQGAAWFQQGATQNIVAVMSGIVFTINPVTRQVRSLTQDVGFLNQYVDRCHFLQVNEFMIVQDGYSRPIIIVAGGAARVSDPDKDEIPPGTIMVYGHGRIFVKVGPRTFRAGDITMPNDADSVLHFKEDKQYDIGGALVVAEDLGEITGMTLASNFDSSTGDGPLLICCQRGIVSFRVDVNRDSWSDVVFSKVQIRGAGVVGSRAVVPMDGDILFWSSGGLRSVATLSSDAALARRVVNLSREMASTMRQETDWLLPLVSMVTHGGRLFITTGGRKIDAVNRSGQPVNDYYFGGIIAADFDQMVDAPAQQSYSYSAVSFDGVWTGPRFTQLLSAAAGLFVFGKDRSNHNIVARLADTATGFDDGTPVHCRLFTRAMVTKMPPDFQDAPFVRKTYETVRIWLRELSDSLNLTLWLSVDGNPYFTRLADLKATVPVVKWDTITGGTPVIGSKQTAPATTFTVPRFACNPASGDSALAGFDFMFCLEWEGLLEFSRLLFAATHQSTYPVPTGHINRQLLEGDPATRLFDFDYSYRSF